MKKQITYLTTFTGTLLLATAFSLSKPLPASAESSHSVAYDEEDGLDEYATDTQKIVAQLEKTGSVKLEKGKVYNLDKIMLKSNWTIDATGATIYCPEGRAMFDHEITKTNYNSLKNVTIKGGKWLYNSKDGYYKSTMHFTHARNIKLLNMTINTTNYEGHTIELVACKNVTISNCKITPKGKPNKSSVEEPIQIDLATESTAPFLAGTKFANGATCQDIKIIKCTVKGNRAVCANYSPRESKYLGKFHSGITIKNCKLTGVSAEALALFNTYSANVTGNTIITKAPLSRDSYSVGCHFHIFGNNSKASKGKITVSKNTIKGGRQALYFFSHSKTGFGTVNVDTNHLYCKNGAANAFVQRFIKKLNAKNNKTYGWK